MEQIFKLLLTIMGASVVWMYGMKALAQPRRLEAHAREDLQTRARTLPHLFGGLSKSPVQGHYLKFVAFYLIFTLVLLSIALLFALPLWNAYA
jgi:hypothetical protein